ncbi:hypothetical protein D8674_009981 [Pyrus ussuriensis x Pyrus communis]|uniref:Uncharacterized protein n=1 Tax=Pyrus ussuriensis x Pyrus communis TaxID=2448454 RepID=A0A5N5FEV2_9ROSA|nr:hypothetical protein D8674_009981 [Pyrus ussuriensis x Pyrus communis]
MDLIGKNAGAGITSASKNANPIVRSPQNKIWERKFVIAKKKSKKENLNVACKCKEKGNSKMCLCVAYENLRASQEEFFKKRNDKVESKSLKESDKAERELEEAINEGLRIHNLQNDVAAAKNEEVGLEGDVSMGGFWV